MAAKAPKPPTSKLAQYRLNLPDRPSQGAIADRVSELAKDDVGQQAVSYWELGKVDLRNVHPRRLLAYARVLNITLNELAEAVGYTLEELFPPDDFYDKVFPDFVDQMTTEEKWNGIFPKRPLDRGVPATLFPNLALAAEMYGKGRNADLNTPRWLNYLNNFDFADGRETDPEGWLELFQTLRRANVEPGEN